jgi:hypothetical protein
LRELLRSFKAIEFRRGSDKSRKPKGAAKIIGVSLYWRKK